MRVCIVTVCATMLATGSAEASVLTTLASFNGMNGNQPQSGLVADASGNLYGTTVGGGANNVGTVFELVKAAATYTVKTLVSFNSGNGLGRTPFGEISLDSSGNLYGTTAYGGAVGDGNVFKLTKNGSNYTLSSLAAFKGASNGSSPISGLISDSSGNFFGTTDGGGSTGYGTVFELVKNGTSYTVKTLATFSDALGGDPFAGLTADSSGNLFGTTSLGGSGGDGTVFELVKQGASYVFNTLVSFTGLNGSTPYGELIVDSLGNLFGTTYLGGAKGAGSVFELAKNGSGYTMTTLMSFSGKNGADPDSALIQDSFGNLFGTTTYGGSNNLGTVFELANTGAGYVLNTLVNFNTTNGANPYAGLLADSSGNLYGTTNAGGVGGYGTAYVVSGSGFGVSAISVPEPASGALLAGGALAVGMRRRRKSARYSPCAAEICRVA
jgi:uncharacterized repeat protein (TIGR03803 family)